MQYPHDYKEKRPIIKAILLGEDNINTVMRWIGARSATRTYQRMQNTIIIDMVGGELIAEIGWWIYLQPDGTFLTCNQQYFEENFEEHYEK